MVHETPDGVAHPEFQVPQADGEATEGRSSRDPEADDATGVPRNSELEDIAVEAERLVRDGVDQAERRIRRHPIAAVGIAAGVGLLLGVLLGRDR